MRRKRSSQGSSRFSRPPRPAGTIRPRRLRSRPQAPWTKPSIATLFTGLYPSQHRVLWHPENRDASDPAPMTSDVLASEHRTLAEALRDAGWHTAGFAQGFEHWDESHATWGKSVGPR